MQFCEKLPNILREVILQITRCLFAVYEIKMVGDGGFSVGEFLKINPVKLFE